jgi:hypothetical protein
VRGVRIREQAQALVVEFTDPVCDDRRREYVAEQVGHGRRISYKKQSARRGTATRQEVVGMLLV